MLAIILLVGLFFGNLKVNAQAPTYICPYNCQAWNPAGSNCAGAPMDSPYCGISIGDRTCTSPYTGCVVYTPSTPTPVPSAPLVIRLAKDPYVAGSGTTALTIESNDGYWIDTGLGAWTGANASNFEISNEKIGIGVSTYPFRSDATYVDGRIRVGPFTGADAYVPRILKLRINGEAGMQWSNPVYLTRLDPNARLPLIFEYPEEGQTLDLEGDYLFKVNDTAGASEYEWKMVQGSVEVSEIRTGSTGLKNEFGILAGNLKHRLFKEGRAMVSVRKKVAGEWGIWTLRNIKLISRYFANCQEEPACLRSVPACRPPEPAEGWCRVVSYKTTSAELLAKNINIRIGDEIYNPGYGERLQVHSDPEYFISADRAVSTLELTWWQYNKEMRIYMYFEYLPATNLWKMYKLSTYNGEKNGDWLFYGVEDKPVQGSGSDHYVNPGIRFFTTEGKFASLDIEGMDLKVNWTSNMSISACSCPAGVPAKSSGNANCDGSIDQADFNLWKSERFNPDGTPRTVPFTPPGPGTSGRQSDFNCDNKIDNVDFETWLTSYKAR